MDITGGTSQQSSWLVRTLNISQYFYVWYPSLSRQLQLKGWSKEIREVFKKNGRRELFNYVRNPHVKV